MRQFVFALALTAAGMQPGYAHAAAYDYTTFDVPGAAGETYATGINDAGDVAGSYRGPDGQFRGFVRSGGTMRTIEVPGAAWTNATDLNDAGQIVGYYGKGGIEHGFLFSAGRFDDLDAPAGDETYPFGINAAGQIAGFFFDESFFPHGFIASGGFEVIDAPASATYVYAISDRGSVVGEYTDAPGRGVEVPFLYADGTFTGFGGPFADVHPYGLNAAGDIAGQLFGGGSYGVAYPDGSFTLFICRAPTAARHGPSTTRAKSRDTSMTTPACMVSSRPRPTYRFRSRRVPPCWRSARRAPWPCTAGADPNARR